MQVLKECISFQKECSLDNSITIDMQNCRLKAAALENALYGLDKLINDCLLRLVFAVFVELQGNPIEHLRILKSELNENENTQNIIDKEIENFDTISDKLQQIGIFAAAFAINHRGSFVF